MKKIIKLITITLVLSFTPFKAVASTWADNYDISWFDKSKISFTLTTNKELAGMAFLVNNGYTTFKGMTIKLGSDIDLSGRDWITIGINYVDVFEGSFDGQGHTISGISIKYQEKTQNAYGFWGDFRGSSIKNTIFKGKVKIDDPISGCNGDTYDVGGIVGRLTRSASISNCVSEMDVYCNKSTPNEKVYVGGICGWAWEYANISYCSHKGNLHASDYYKNTSNPPSIGGIAGGSSNYVKIEYCENLSSEITCHTPSKRGNITGAGIAGISGGHPTISYCRSIINNIEFDNDCAGTTWFYISGIGSKSINCYSIINKIKGNSVRMWYDVGGARYGGVVAEKSSLSTEYAKACFSNSDVSHEMPSWVNFITQNGADGNTSFSSAQMKTANFLDQLNVYSQIELGKGIWTVDENGYPCIKETHVASSTEPSTEPSTNDNIVIDATNFPDANFRNYLLEQNYGKDGVLSEDEIKSIDEINVYDKAINNLTGLHFFTALLYLDCRSNNIKSLDISKNTSLTNLYCENNQLSKLDVSNNKKLKLLRCDNNNIASLDVSNNTLITDFRCKSNQLETLNISKNTALYYFDCSSNKLKLLDVSNNPSLYYLSCYNNQLTSIDLTNNTKLEIIDCAKNQLISLDLSRNTALTTLYSYDCQLTTLDLSKNNTLKKVYCYSNLLTSLIVSQSGDLVYLECYGNTISSDKMDALINSLPRVSSNKGQFKVVFHPETDGNVCTPTQVAAAKSKGWISYYYGNYQWVEFDGYEKTAIDETSISIDATNFPDENFRKYLFDQDYGKDGVITGEEIKKISSISVSGTYSSPGTISNLKGIEYFTAITYLGCSYNQITSLDISKNTLLERIYCDDNKLTSLNVSNNTALTFLRCSRNQLSSLDVSKNILLTTLECQTNYLTTLDVSKNKELSRLHCANNQLTTLDVSNNLALEELIFSENQISNIDVSNNTLLSTLTFYKNNITSLDVTNNKKLTDLCCYQNQLNSLNLKNNTLLTYLYCDSNPLSTLDVSNNVLLTYLRCSKTQLTTLNVSKNVNLATLGCSINDLSYLDISKNVSLEYFDCYNNQLSSLDLSKNVSLKRLECDNNQLSSLDLSKNIYLESLRCFKNQIRGAEMDALISSLPYKASDDGNSFKVIFNPEIDGNVCTTLQAAAAKAKGWTPSYYIDGWVEYPGSDPTGIDEVWQNEDVNVPIYNLNGQRIDKPRKGLNIIGGKKVFVK